MSQYTFSPHPSFSELFQKEFIPAFQSNNNLRYREGETCSRNIKNSLNINLSIRGRCHARRALLRGVALSHNSGQQLAPQGAAALHTAAIWRGKVWITSRETSAPVAHGERLTTSRTGKVHLMCSPTELFQWLSVKFPEVNVRNNKYKNQFKDVFSNRVSILTTCHLREEKKGAFAVTLAREFSFRTE